MPTQGIDAYGEVTLTASFSSPLLSVFLLRVEVAHHEGIALCIAFTRIVQNLKET